MKRLAPGYYTLDYKGQIIEVIKSDVDKETIWYFTINEGGAEDFFVTKKECLESVKYLIDHADKYDIILK